MGIWDNFNDIASIDEVKEGVNETKYSNEPLPVGNYIMTLQEMNPSESKNGLPMIKGIFRLDNNRPVFYNQMLQNLSNPQFTALNIAEAVNFLSGLIGEEIEYTGLSQLEEIVNGLEAGIVAEINVSYGKNDFEQKFPKLKVVKLVTDGDEAF